MQQQEEASKHPQEETLEFKEYEDDSFEVHDARGFGVFFIDDVIMDKHVTKIGAHSLAVYCLLARIIGHRGSHCSLSLNNMVEKLGCCSKKSVNKALKRLESHGLIRRERQETPSDSTPDLYTLLNPRV